MRLPDTWAEVSLSAVVLDIQPGFAQSPGVGDEGTVPQIRTHNVSPRGKLTLEGIKHVTPSTSEVEKYSLVPGDVVFNNTNSEEWVGKTAVFREPGQFVFSNHMTRIRAREDVADPEYLGKYLHFLWSLGYSRNRAKRWVNQAAIDAPTLTRFKVPLPTPGEQRRIIALLQDAEEIEQLRALQIEDVSQIARERFYDLFGHPAENLRGFELASLARLGDFDRGVSKHRPRDASHLYGGPYPFIQTGDVTNAGDWITKYTSTYSEAGLAQSRLWPKGTLCITIAANIARAAILDFDACFPDSVVGFLPHEGVHTEYVLYCLRFYQELFEYRAPKSAQMNINLETLRALRVPRPPEHEQRQFAEFVRTIRSVTDDLISQHESLLSLEAEMTAAAFSGELSEDWRSHHLRELRRAELDRRLILVDAAKRASTSIRDYKPEPVVARAWPARAWLLEQLSEFQDGVHTVLNGWERIVTPDDPDAFDQFCREKPIENGENAKDHVRRALEQLASLGLITKLSLRNATGKFVTGYRSLREDEDTRLADALSLQSRLSKSAE